MSDARSSMLVPLDADPGMNMTPMIDVVFQLIVFFLLTLRFHEVEHRLEASLPEPGLAWGPPPPDDHLPIRVTLHRRLATADAPALTRVKVGPGDAVELPEDPARRATVLEGVLASIQDQAARMGSGPETRGEIRAPLPTGAWVPHGDVMSILDCFVRAEIGDVVFQGTPEPSSALR
jgi:hypothetical protein